MSRPITSKKMSIRREDVDKWIYNVKKFAAPLVLIYAASVISQLTNGGFDINYFAPSNMVVGAMALYVMNAIYDLTTKWLSENKYQGE